MKNNLFVVLLLLIIAFTNCKKSNDSVDINEIIVTLSKNQSYPFEIVQAETSVPIESQNIEIRLNNQNISFSTIENTINFMIPDIASGKYNLEISVDNSKNKYEFEIINEVSFSDANEFVANYFDTLDYQRIVFKTIEDSLLKDSLIVQDELEQRRAFWDQKHLSLKQQYTNLSADEKLLFAKVIDANKDWLYSLDDDITGYVDLKKGGVCSDLINSGREYLKNTNSLGGKMFAMGRAISAYFCAWTAKKYNNTIKNMQKASHFARNIEFSSPSFGSVLGLVTNLTAEKIEQLNEEVRALGKSPSIAYDVENEYTYKSNQRIDFCNGVGVKTYLKIKYRSLQASDIGSNTVFSDFAKFYSDFIFSYEGFMKSLTDVSVKDQLYIYRPKFENTTRVLEMNQFLSVSKTTVSNDKVVFINTQFENQGKDWVIIFATDEAEKQSFTFNIDYNDGYVQLSKKVNATVEDCEGCGGITYIVDPRDGKKYNIVKIGDVCWMAENLNYWSEELKDNCYCPEDKPENCDQFGMLYQWWEAANTACPEGWRLPTKSDFSKLINSFNYNSGDAIAQIMSTAHWYNKLGTNETKFNALPIPPLGKIQSYNCLDDDCINKEPEIFDRSSYWTSTYSNQATRFVLDISDNQTPFANLTGGSELYWSGRYIRCVKE